MTIYTLFYCKMHFQLRMKSTDGYDYIGESLRDKIEPFMIDPLNLSRAWNIDISTIFGTEGSFLFLRSDIVLCIDHNSHYDYIGDTVREELEDLIIHAIKKDYQDILIKIVISPYVAIYGYNSIDQRDVKL